MGWGLIEDQLLHISPVSSCDSGARREHDAKREDLQAACNLDLPNREMSRGEELESFRAGFGAEVQPVHAKATSWSNFLHCLCT